MTNPRDNYKRRSTNPLLLTRCLQTSPITSTYKSKETCIQFVHAISIWSSFVCFEHFVNSLLAWSQSTWAYKFGFYHLVAWSTWANPFPAFKGPDCWYCATCFTNQRSSNLMFSSGNYNLGSTIPMYPCFPVFYVPCCVIRLSGHQATEFGWFSLRNKIYWWLVFWLFITGGLRGSMTCWLLLPCRRINNEYQGL